VIGLELAPHIGPVMADRVTFTYYDRK